jgi:Domain of unknown function DUF11/Regulator of chromosome condensation (RCC1) repeat
VKKPRPSQVLAILALLVVAAMVPAATAEQAGSKNRSFQAGLLDAGDSHSCAVLASEAVTCWGRDQAGQLGDGGMLPGADTSAPAPVSLPGGQGAVAISAGASHTCAISASGAVFCWGSDSAGQLGDGGAIPGPDTSAPPATPVSLPGGQRAIAISVGREHTCAVLASGAVSCWGRDVEGQLGDGGPNTALAAPPAVPVALPGGQTAVAISAGGDHTCALLASGAVSCWGWDNAGQLGDGGTIPGADAPAPPATPVALPGGQSAVAISAGRFHSCALLASGAVSCWGRDDFGQLGDGGPVVGPGASAPAAPVALPGGQGAMAIAAGREHTCALLSSGAISCWGRDNFGQLGDGGVIPGTDVSAPGTLVSFSGGEAALTISAGREHTCALLSSGATSCWGYDDSGQLGDGGPVPGTNTSAPATAALPAGSLTARVADLSIDVIGAPATVALGAATQTTLRIQNAGPDPATGVKVTLSSTLLQITSTFTGQGSVAGSVWDVGTLAPGGQSSALVTLTASAAGAATFTAEVTASGAKDPDSEPNNGVATEDDRAQVAITVTAAAATPPPVATALKLTKLSLTRKTFRSQGLKGTRKVGTTISFTLSTDATVTFTIERKVGTKFKRAGTIRFTAKKGIVKRVYSGRLAGKPLGIGKYRLRVQAKAGTTTVSAKPVSFNIATR